MNDSTYNPITFWSRLSGLSILIMAVAAGYAYGYSFNQIHIPGDPIGTLSNIQDNTALFLSGAYLWCVILLTDLIVSYGFYRCLKPINKPWALASGIIRFIYSLILALAIAFLFNKDTETFLIVWSLGLFIFGFHLVATGVGTLYSNAVPKVFGILLIIAGIGYSLINGLQNFFPQWQTIATALETLLVIPMTAGELFFAVWLLIRGGKAINPQPSNSPAQDVL